MSGGVNGNRDQIKEGRGFARGKGGAEAPRQSREQLLLDTRLYKSPCLWFRDAIPYLALSRYINK
jgi:hypothetical protein